jgi:hypothetical protein
MHGQLNMRPAPRSSTRENILILLSVVLALVLVEVSDRQGIPQKWHAAIVGTIIPFMAVVARYRLRWRQWYFWISLGICFLIHTIAIWIVFKYVLWNVRGLGILLWAPIAFVEMFVLLIAVRRLEQLLTGKTELVNLS